MATSNYLLPPPQPLEIHDPQVAEKWKKFKRAWTSYALATELKGKDEALGKRPEKCSSRSRDGQQTATMLE